MSYLDSVFSLSGKVVVVTGATGGIGQAITLSLAEAGASKVYALDLDNNAIWPNSNIENYSLDLQDENQINKFVDYISHRHTDGANILVNCAGVTFTNDFFFEYSKEDWDTTYRGQSFWLHISCRKGLSKDM